MSKILTTHVTVGAAVEDVWAVLTDLASYHRWNPFITAAAGTISVGQRLDLTVQPRGGRPTRSRPWVTAVETHHYVEWLTRMALPGVLDGRHSFTLTPIHDGRTLVQQSASFSGALVPFSGAARSRTKAGLAAMNTALSVMSVRHGSP